MKNYKNSLILLLVLVLAICMTACSRTQTPAPTNSGVTEPTEAAVNGELVILFTNDVHNAYQRDDELGRLGYAALAAYRDELENAGSTVILVDAGDAIQGEAVGTLSKGAYLVDIMNKTGYTLCVPGNHEFDFGMETFLDLAENRAEYEYISCNFVDLRTGATVFAPYRIFDYGDVQVAFIGISTPETFTKSTPTYFQDNNGNYIYSFAEGNNGEDLYECVQQAIDSAKREGADYVVAIGHLGVDPTSTPWTSVEVIANTTGLNAFLDGHSHSIIDGELIEDKDSNEVLLTSTGTKLVNVGEVHLDLNTGVATSQLVNGLTKDSTDILNYTNDIAAQFEDLLGEVVAQSETDLVTQDPEDNEKRIIRSQETNLGDLCADAYRVLLGADVGFINGGGIRAEITTGDVTYGDIIAIHPFGNTICMVEATGQQILDALELAYMAVGVSENGGFLHVSGLTCEIDTSIESTVVLDEKDTFIEVSGERRVKNVQIGGVDIDPEKTYTVASHNFMLKNGGDGYSMFLGTKILQDEVMIDNQALIIYIQDTLGGIIPADLYGDPYGQGRIVIK